MGTIIFLSEVAQEIIDRIRKTLQLQPKKDRSLDNRDRRNDSSSSILNPNSTSILKPFDGVPT